MDIELLRKILIASDRSKWLYDEKNNCIITTGSHFKTVLEKAEKMNEIQLEEGEIKEASIPFF